MDQGTRLRFIAVLGLLLVGLSACDKSSEHNAAAPASTTTTEPRIGAQARDYLVGRGATRREAACVVRVALGEGQVLNSHFDRLASADVRRAAACVGSLARLRRLSGCTELVPPTSTTIDRKRSVAVTADCSVTWIEPHR
jgi:hypothetical protein